MCCSVQREIKGVSASRPFEGDIVGHQLGMEETERMLQLVALGTEPREQVRQKERERDGWMGMEVWEREKEKEEDLDRAFLFLLLDLAHCHTQSSLPSSLTRRVFVSTATTSHVSLTTPLPILLSTYTLQYCLPCLQSPMQRLLWCGSDKGSLERRWEDGTRMKEL